MPEIRGDVWARHWQNGTSNCCTFKAIPVSVTPASDAGITVNSCSSSGPGLRWTGQCLTEMNLNGSSASKSSLSCPFLSRRKGWKMFQVLLYRVCRASMSQKIKVNSETQAQNEPLVELSAINVVTIRISGVLRSWCDSAPPRMGLTCGQWGCRGISPLFSECAPCGSLEALSGQNFGGLLLCRSPSSALPLAQ